MEHLPVLAEVSVAFAGFISIFLIFARRDGRFEKHDSLRVEAIFTASFMAVFMALAPLALSHSDMSAETIFRITSGMAAVGVAVVLTSVGVRQFALPAESRKKIGLINNLYAWPVGIFSVASLASIAFGINPAPAELLYNVIIVLMLGICTSNFVTIAKQKLS